MMKKENMLTAYYRVSKRFLKEHTCGGSQMGSVDQLVAFKSTLLYLELDGRVLWNIGFLEFTMLQCSSSKPHLKVCFSNV